MSLPPKAPPPLVLSVNHFQAELDWGEYLDRLQELMNKNDGRIAVEIMQFDTSRDESHVIYAGFDKRCKSSDLTPDTRYIYKMRFRNKLGWGEYSNDVEITTSNQPLTGEHLHKAIRMEDEVELRRILSKGEAHVDAQDMLGFTPLMAAAQKGSYKLLPALIQYNADLECETEAGKTALMLAAYKGQIECLEFLLKNGAKPDHKDKSGITALHQAVDGEKPEAVNILIHYGASPNVIDNSLHWTPLLRCAGLKNNGNISVAKMLLRGGAAINTQDRDGKTALILAAMNNHHKLCDFLLSEGAAIDIKNHQGYTAMDIAVSMEFKNVKDTIILHLNRLQRKNSSDK